MISYLSLNEMSTLIETDNFEIEQVNLSYLNSNKPLKFNHHFALV